MSETETPFPREQTLEYQQGTATAREHLENAGKERSILPGRPI